MNNTTELVVVVTAVPAILVAATVLCFGFLWCARSASAPRPQRAVVNEVEVAQVPDITRQAPDVVDGIEEEVPDGVVVFFEGAEFFILSPFEPPLFNTVDLFISAILIFFVFILLIYVVIRAAKNLLCTNHFVRIH